MVTKVKKIGSTILGFFSLINKIQTKLIIAFMLPIGCIVTLGIISYNTASAIIINNYENQMNQTLDMTGQYYSFSLKSVEADLNELYQSIDLRDYFKGLYSVTPTKELQLFNSTQTSMKEKSWADALIENMYILTDNKSFLTTKAKDNQLYTSYSESSEGKEVLSDLSTYHWFGSNADLDELMDSDSSKYALRLARHFANTNAVLIADLNRNEIVSILNRLHMENGSYLALVTKDGAEIPSDNLDMQENTGANIFYSQQFYKDAVNGQKASDIKYVEFNKQNYLFIYNKIDDTGLVVCSLIPKQNILMHVSKIKSITVIIVLITCIISAVICTIIVSGIGNTITYMKKQLKKVSGGDLTVEIITKRHDEFSSLAHDITNMISNMKNLIQKVKDVGIELVTTIDFLANTSKTFIHTTKNIKGAVGEIEEGIIQLDGNSEDCMNQMSTLSDKINLVHENTDRIGKITNSTGTSINVGIRTMEDLNAKAQDTSIITDRVIATIKLLEEKTNQIGNIVKVIDEISEQTNLLSLNASIESARVGAAGRGFAVIANEIRKLSDSTLNSSKQIQIIINEIVQNINVAVNTTKEAEIIVQLQKDALKNTTESFSIMDQQIGEMIKETDAILKNVMNMEQARLTTEEAIQSISAVSEETTACSDTVSNTVSEQIETVSQVDDTINKLIQNADILSAAINQFIM